KKKKNFCILFLSTVEISLISIKIYSFTSLFLLGNPKSYLPYPLFSSAVNPIISKKLKYLH
ncbi:hypothetical protein BCR36DRAFT_157603, partial [Piromyces finnis]